MTGYPPICLEKGKQYKVRIEFEAFPEQDPSRNIGTLIDSVSGPDGSSGPGSGPV